MEEDPPPFWLQNTNERHRERHQNRQATNFLFSTGVLVIVVLATAALFLIIVIPSVMSVTRRVLNPSLMMSSWSSLSVVLVIFAIVCGFLGKKGEDRSLESSPMKREVEKSVEDTQSEWYDEQENVNGMRRLRRNSSSYPDLRQESPWVIRESVCRSYDDQHDRVTRSPTGVGYYRSFVDVDEDAAAENIEVDTASSRCPPPPPPPRPPSLKVVYGGRFRRVVNEDESSTRNIEMDASFMTSQPNVMSYFPIHQPTPTTLPIYTRPSTSYACPPPSPPTYLWPPPPPPRPPPRQLRSIMKKKSKETYEAIYHQSERDTSHKREHKSKVQFPPPPPPPPPPQPAPVSRPMSSKHTKEKKDKSEKKKGGISKDFLTSFYHQRKRNEKHKRSYENLELVKPHEPKVSIYRSKSTPEFPPLSSPRQPPPPLPPPPPPSVFHNLFSPRTISKNKKKVHSIPTTAPPPRKVSQPVKTASLNITTDENSGNGSESPLILIPPPPPPPPFKVPSWKFVTHGDYVKIESNNNSPRSGYSASEDEAASPSTSTKPPLFFPSPDVNTKADDFIARFRNKLKLEKMNSIKQKQGTGHVSPLGSYQRWN